MDCTICQRFRHTFLCPKCVLTLQSKHLRIRQQLENTNATLRELVHRQLENMKKPVFKDPSNYIMQLQRIKHLRLLKENMKHALDVENEKLNQLKESTRQRKSFLQKYTSQLHSYKSKKLTDLSTKLETIQKDLQATRATNAHACRVLIKELMKLFQLNPGVNGVEPTVHGLPIPDNLDFTDTPKELLNTALGHVVHFLNLLSMYLAFLLPFHLHFELSTSTAHFHYDLLHPIPIYDGTDPFPLGLAMLNHQLCCLAHHVHLTFPSPFALLTNLLQCCQHITSSSTSTATTTVTTRIPSSPFSSFSSSSSFQEFKGGTPSLFRQLRRSIHKQLQRSTIELGYRMVHSTKEEPLPHEEEDLMTNESCSPQEFTTSDTELVDEDQDEDDEEEKALAKLKEHSSSTTTSNPFIQQQQIKYTKATSFLSQSSKYEQRFDIQDQKQLIEEEEEWVCDGFEEMELGGTDGVEELDELEPTDFDLANKNKNDHETHSKFSVETGKKMVMEPSQASVKQQKTKQWVHLSVQIKPSISSNPSSSSNFAPSSSTKSSLKKK